MLINAIKSFLNVNGNYKNTSFQACRRESLYGQTVENVTEHRLSGLVVGNRL